MNENPHIRATQLIARKRIEGISTEEQSWLAAHLATCEPCSAVQTQTAEALNAFRSMNIEIPRNLAARAQMRVRLRAEELPTHNPGRALLLAIAAVSI